MTPLNRIAKPSAAFLGSNLARAAIGFALTLAIGRGLGADRFGQWVLCTTWASLLTVAADLGFGVLLTRDGARPGAPAARLVGGALRLRLAVAIPLARDPVCVRRPAVRGPGVDRGLARGRAARHRRRGVRMLRRDAAVAGALAADGAWPRDRLAGAAARRIVVAGADRVEWVEWVRLVGWGGLGRWSRWGRWDPRRVDGARDVRAARADCDGPRVVALGIRRPQADG